MQHSELTDEELELKVMGYILAKLNNICLITNLDAKYFHNAIHRKIIEVVFILEKDNMSTRSNLDVYFYDTPVVRDYLNRFFSWTNESVEDINTFVKHLKELYEKREFLSFCHRMIKKIASNPQISIDDVHSDTSSWLSSNNEENDHDVVSLGESLAECLALMQEGKSKQTGILSGLPKLDRQIHGFFPGDLVVIGGRPGLGKTALVTTIGLNATLAGKQVLFFSLEMKIIEIAFRILSRLVGRPCSLRHEPPSPGKLNEMRNAINSYLVQVNETKGDFVISKSKNITLSKLRQSAIRQQRKHGLDLIMIDYLQLMTPDLREETRTQEISLMTRGLKLLALELNIPIIFLSQLSRAAEGTASAPKKPPKASHLKESGSIEQDGETIILLDGPDYSQQQNPPLKRAITLNVVKSRHGPVGAVDMHFNAPLAYFE